MNTDEPDDSVPRYATEFDEVHRQFLQLEEDLDLFGLTIDGMHVWERLRTGVWMDLLTGRGLTGDVYGNAISRRDRLRGAYLLLRNVVVRNPFLASPAEILFMGHPRRKRLSDTWWDIYCDPIHEHTEFDSLHVESSYFFKHYRPARTPGLRYTDLIEILSLVNSKLRLSRYEFTPAERATVAETEAQIRSRFGVDLELQERVRTEIEARRVAKPLYSRLLKRLDPRLVVIVAYSREHTFIESCHDCGIPVVELQHGQMSRYSYQHSFPGDRTKYAFPDYLFTFGEFWNTAADFPIAEDRVRDVGYPYLEQEVAKRSDTDQRDQIVFVSTAESGQKLTKIAVEVSMRSAVTSDVVCKLHPDEYDRWRAEYPWLTDAPVSVAAGDGPSLYDLFAESSVQVGVGSTALYEGLAFGLPTYVVKLPTVEWSAPIIENGEATLVESADELVTHLSAPTTRTVTPTTYFTPNAIENITKELDSLLSEATVAKKQ